MPNVQCGGFIDRVKILSANFFRLRGEEPSYMLHAECAHKMISWAMHQRSLGGPEKLAKWGASHEQSNT